MAKEPNFNPELGSSEAYLELMTNRVQHAQEKLDDVVNRHLGPQAEAAAHAYLQEQQTNLQSFIQKHPELQDLAPTHNEITEEF